MRENLTSSSYGEGLETGRKPTPRQSFTRQNNILTEKHQGYEYEHCYYYTWNAMEGFHYLMKIGRLLNVLALNSVLLSDKVKELGIRGFITHLKLVCSGSPLNKAQIQKAREGKQLWKLKPAV
ncbi:MAG: hypothetical protein FH756_12345 [Firmicutes bacterium]|nr:hypothetical protein [Bacillota bacterium]